MKQFLLVPIWILATLTQANAAGAALIKVSSEIPRPGEVINFSAPGISDWMQFGTMDCQSGPCVTARKTNGTGLMGAYTWGAHDTRFYAFTPNLVKLAWTDSTAAWDGTAGHINNDNLLIQALAGTEDRTLTLVAGLTGGGKLTLNLHLSDGGVADVNDSQTFPGVGVRVYTIHFAAASAGRTLSVAFTKSAGEFAIYGAALHGTLRPETHYLDVHDNLQGFVDTAQGGDTLVLPDGYSWIGHLTLPARADSGWVTLASNVAVPAGHRVKPGDIKATITSPDELPAIQNDLKNPDHAKRKAHGWRFTGIEITADNKRAGVNYNLVLIGYGDNPTLADAPRDFEFDRCFIHGDGIHSYNRGIMGNADNITVKDSYMSGFVSDFMEANTINVYSSAGPINIINNYLEAAGENVMIGGTGPDVGPALIPTRGLIQHNYFFKPMSWRESKFIVKNLLEFKDGYNFKIDSNVFENDWMGGQNGTAILITPRTGAGGTAANHIDTLSFTNNIIRHSGSGMIIGIIDDLAAYPKDQLQLVHDITLKNNLFDDLSMFYAAFSHGLLIAGPPNNLILDHNTFNFRENQNDHSWWLVGETGLAPSNAVVTNNLFGCDLFGDSRGGGPLAILEGAVFTGNVIQNANPDWKSSRYRKTNQFNVKTVPVETGADAVSLRANEAAVKSGNR